MSVVAGDSGWHGSHLSHRSLTAPALPVPGAVSLATEQPGVSWKSWPVATEAPGPAKQAMELPGCGQPHSFGKPPRKVAEPSIHAPLGVPSGCLTAVGMSAAGGVCLALAAAPVLRPPAQTSDTVL